MNGKDFIILGSIYLIYTIAMYLIFEIKVNSLDIIMGMIISGFIIQILTKLKNRRLIDNEKKTY